MKEMPSLLIPKLRDVAVLIAGTVGFVVVAGIGGWWLLAASEDAAREIHVEGPFRHVLPDEVSAVVRPLLAAPVGAMNLEQVRLQVEQLPWIARARVQRQWPASLRIRIWERTAVARWGENQLLDSEARSFSPAPEEISPDLPLLQAPAGHEREVLDTYERLKSALEGSDLQPTALALDARGEWVSRSAQGLEMRLGRAPPHDQAPLILGALTRALQGNFGQVLYVDLRYSNGFSVGWAPQQIPAQDGGAGNG